MKNPKVSIVINNYNGKKYLGAALDSIKSQDYKSIETIVVDSASSDGSADFVREKYPWVKLIALKVDGGGPYSNNLGCKESTGEFIVLLNSDAKLRNGTIKKMLDAVGDRKDIVVSPIQLEFENNDVTGAGCPYYWGAGILWRLMRAKGKKPFYLSIACCLAHRDLYKIWPFNENFPIYEDIEWAWRIQLLGGEIGIVNDAGFHHKVGGSTISKKFAFHYARSVTATHFVCMKLSTIIVLSPIIAYNYAKVFFVQTFLKRNPRFGPAFLKGLWSFVCRLRLYVKDHVALQKTRRLSEMSVMRLMAQSHDFENNYKKSARI